MLGLCLKDREQLAEARDGIRAGHRHLPGVHSGARRARGPSSAAGAHPRGDRAARRAFALDPAKAERLIAVGLAYLRAGNRDLAVITLGAAAELFPNIPACMPLSARSGSRPPKSAATRATCAKALEALEPIATQATASSETLGLYGRALCWRASTHEPKPFSSRRPQRFPTDPDVLPHYASVAQRLGHLDDARQALLRYSILVDDDREQAAHAARIADLSLQLNDARRRGCVVSEISSARHRRRVAARTARRCAGECRPAR